MNFKTTSILAILLLALAGYMFLSRDKGTDTTETPTVKKLLDLTGTDVQSFTITPSEGKAIAFEKNGNEWKITQPIAAPAEGGVVQALVNDLSTLESQNEYEVSEGMGLKTPRFVIDLKTKAGKTATLNVGDKSGIGDRLYVQVKGNAKADAVAAGIDDQLEKSLDDFRQKRMVALGAPEIKDVSIERPGTKIEMVKDGAEWKVISPEAMPADAAAVGELLTSIISLQAGEFVEGDMNSPLYGLGDGAKTITIATAVPATTQPTTVPTSQPAPVKILIGRADTVLEKNLYATVAGSNTVVTIPKASLAFLDKKPLDFRDKKVADINPASVKKLLVTINHPATTQPTTKPAEVKSFAIVRRPPPATQASTAPSTQPKPSTWMLIGASPDALSNDSVVESILASLHPMHTEHYVESVPTAGTTVTLTLETGGGGVLALGKTELQIVDPGDAKPPVATYNGLHFEFERQQLEKLESLEADFGKPSRPAPQMPEQPEMGPGMMP